jgi:hypothetical protein
MNHAPLEVALCELIELPDSVKILRESGRLEFWVDSPEIIAVEAGVRPHAPPHIQPPMAHVPSAMRETFSWVSGISTNSISAAGVRAASVDADMELASRRL